MAETITFGSTELTAVGIVPLDGWADLLKGGPTNGDVIEFDFSPDAEWEPGEPGTYSVVVPVVMPADPDPENLWDGAQSLIALRGVEDDLSYTYGSTSASCRAVITGEVACTWGPRSLLTVIMVFQILTPWEPGSGS